jgi:hypothetical protein
MILVVTDAIVLEDASSTLKFSDNIAIYLMVEKCNLITHIKNFFFSYSFVL